jgi:hypothetical protein
MQVVLQEYGVWGLWRGTGPTVVRLSFGAGINFVALEKLKQFMLDVLPHASGQLGYLQAAAVGGEWKANGVAFFVSANTMQQMQWEVMLTVAFYVAANTKQQMQWEVSVRVAFYVIANTMQPMQVSPKCSANAAA